MLELIAVIITASLLWVMWLDYRRWAWHVHCDEAIALTRPEPPRLAWWIKVSR